MWLYVVLAGSIPNIERHDEAEVDNRKHYSEHDDVTGGVAKRAEQLIHPRHVLKVPAFDRLCHGMFHDTSDPRFVWEYLKVLKYVMKALMAWMFISWLPMKVYARMCTCGRASVSACARACTCVCALVGVCVCAGFCTCIHIVVRLVWCVYCGLVMHDVA